MKLTTAHVKICGITQREHARLISDLGFGAIGFILFPKSPRNVELEAVAEIAADIQPLVKKIAVVVNRSLDDCLSVWRSGLFDCLQLHGDETPELCSQLLTHGVKYYKAFRVSEEFDFNALSAYPPGPVLLDTYQKDKYGGTGSAFNWSLLARVEGKRPVILSGGVTADNALQAFAQPGVGSIDISSGVESSSGVKSAEKITALARLINSQKEA